jgi:uncharacterized membrane protein YfbV (UPF0208 family)
MVAGCTFVAAFAVLTRMLLAGDLREAVTMAPARVRGLVAKVLML